jgi:AmmeMemoRadiSam system protein B
VEVDAPLTDALLRSGQATADAEAHRGEHAVEVQLPLLQRRLGAFTLAALCLGDLPWARCEALGRAVAAALRERGPAALIASTDMSHDLPADAARALDRRALDPLLALDARALHETVRREEISMCGVIPTTVALVAARELGARAATLVRYGHSGETSGDLDRVVGYAGAIVA